MSDFTANIPDSRCSSKNNLMPTEITSTREEAIGRWMPDARAQAAQCWTDKETSNIKMDARLAEAFALRLARWMHSACKYSDSAVYYRGLLDRCGRAIGDEAYTSDDGSRQEDVLASKIPVIVEELVRRQSTPFEEVAKKVVQFDVVGEDLELQALHVITSALDRFLPKNGVENKIRPRVLRYLMERFGQ